MRFYWTSGIAAFLGLVALVVSLGKPAPHRINTSAFVTRSELGMSRADLNIAANDVINNELKQVGYRAVRLLVIRESINGDNGTVVEDVNWTNRSDGAIVGGAEVTLRFHRSIWSLSQTHTAALPAS